MNSELPKTISCGDELEVQLCPYGDFEKSGILQRCDSAAFQRLLNNFDGRREVLVDFDHAAEQGGSTRAAAWLTAMREDPERGLMGTLKFTDVGAVALLGSRRRRPPATSAFDWSDQQTEYTRRVSAQPRAGHCYGHG